MLSPPTPFPQVGSYGLYLDKALPLEQQIAEPARILERGADVLFIALPLRAGAAGNQRVALDNLIDATPLDAAEKRELAELQNHLRDRARLTPKMKLQKARLMALANRALWQDTLHRLLRRVAERAAATAPVRAAA